ncbi:hypothetical protein niasHT_019029 [Heterodera trifolii]|uniref:Reverse transcriptase domain-containing protein n=1 Tax=Heterodera trifolii TaxID=157864 RepID=A0ABD2KXS6_9BILA
MPPINLESTFRNYERIPECFRRCTWPLHQRKGTTQIEGRSRAHLPKGQTGLGIIRKVEHLDWAAPILVVKKADGNARLCDYSTGLNDALIDYQHPLPIPEDIFVTLNGGQFFSQIDLKDAYFQDPTFEDTTFEDPDL